MTTVTPVVRTSWTESLQKNKIKLMVRSGNLSNHKLANLFYSKTQINRKQTKDKDGIDLAGTQMKR